jgi:hypothetical protein
VSARAATAVCLALAIASGAAAADDEPPATARASSDEPTAADVAKAPPPGQESGRLDEPQGDSVLREVGQGVLTVPRVALEVAMAPVRGGLWAYERYGVTDRFRKTFYDKTDTYGVHPMLAIDSTYGITLGARLSHRNLLGAGEQLRLRTAIGGEFREVLDARLTTGERLGDRVTLEAGFDFERRPRDPFFGIGNVDDAVETRHRQGMVRGLGKLDVRATRQLHVGLAGAVTDLEYERSDQGPPIDEIYDPSMLTGWTGMRNLYGELELRRDTRRNDNPFSRHAVFDRGTLLLAYAGRVHQLEMGDDYWRVGGDVQRFFPLGGVRSLILRGHVEAVTGGLGDVAFSQLPQLGGNLLLRGYPQERFRDRIATLGSVEYFWDLSRIFMASVFVDAGKVHRSLDELSASNMRVGFGGTLQIHSNRNFISSLVVGTSIDGGVVVNLAFDPVFKPQPRVERR